MPKDDWRHPGTKQGVYMIGPQGEYLEGGGAISGSPEKVRERLQRALDRWKELRKKAKYANKPVPRVVSAPPPEIGRRKFILRAFLRDLPRAKGDASGRRFSREDLRGMWMDFVKWAWNVNWIGFDDAKVFRTQSKKAVPIDDETTMRICREILKDNVRGQNPSWPREAVTKAELTKRSLGTRNRKTTYEYVGQAIMRHEGRSYEPKIYGRAVWDQRKRRFESFEILAIGQRAGAGTFNQRARDLGPAPMGVVLRLHAPSPDTKQR